MDLQNADQAKVDLEHDMMAKISHLVTEGAKYKKGFENANKAVINFVGKTKEKAKNAFLMSFFLARKQALDWNSEVDLSRLNGLVCLARSTEWFSPEFLKLASSITPAPNGRLAEATGCGRKLADGMERDARLPATRASVGPCYNVVMNHENPQMHTYTYK